MMVAGGTNALAVRDPESILRFAVERGASVDVIERLMLVREKLQAEFSKEKFDEALAAFQSECPVITKTKAVKDKGGAVRYWFAPLDVIVTQVKGLLMTHGFSYSLTAKVEGGMVEAICKLTHRNGHSQVSEFKVPIDPKAFMSEAQKFAAALTYAKRYAFVNALGILTADEDTDGAGGGQKKGIDATENLRALAQTLWDLLKPVRGTEKNWEVANRFLIDECILEPDEAAPELTPERFRAVIETARGKLDQMKLK